VHIEKAPISFNTDFASESNETNISNHTNNTFTQNYTNPHQKDVNINLQVKNKMNKNISETDYLITDMETYFTIPIFFCLNHPHSQGITNQK